MEDLHRTNNVFIIIYRGKNYPSILEDETLLTIAADKGKSAAQVK